MDRAACSVDFDGVGAGLDGLDRCAGYSQDGYDEDVEEEHLRYVGV